MKVEDIIEEASKFSEEERASIASRLIHGLERPYHYVMDEEVAERVQEGEADAGAMMTLDELKSGVRGGGNQVP